MENEKVINKALLIGISSYNDSIINLNSPAKNVEKFKEILIKYSYFSEEDIEVKTNLSSEEAYNEIEKYSSSMYEGNGGIFLFLFSGHGKMIGINKSSEEHYLLFTDYDKKNLRKEQNSSIKTDLIIQTVTSNLADQKKLFILDACYSSRLNWNWMSKTMSVHDNHHPSPLFKLDSPESVAFCSSSDISQAEYMDERGQKSDHSLFMHFFIKVIEEGLTDNKEYSGKTNLNDIHYKIKELLNVPEHWNHLKNQYFDQDDKRKVNISPGFWDPYLHHKEDKSLVLDNIFKTKYYYELPDYVKGIQEKLDHDKRWTLDKLDELYGNKYERDISFHSSLEKLLDGLSKENGNKELRETIHKLYRKIGKEKTDPFEAIRYQPGYGRKFNVVLYNLNDPYEQNEIYELINNINKDLITTREIFIQLFSYSEAQDTIDALNTDEKIASASSDNFDLCMVYFSKLAPVSTITKPDISVPTSVSQNEMHPNSQPVDGLHVMHFINSFALQQKPVIFMKSTFTSDSKTPRKFIESQNVINDIWNESESKKIDQFKFFERTDIQEAFKEGSIEIKRSCESRLQYLKEKEIRSAIDSLYLHKTLQEEEILQAYLSWAVELYGQLEIRGVTSERKTIPLEHVYVELKGDLTSQYEKSQEFTIIQNQIAKKLSLMGSEISEDEHTDIVLNILSQSPQFYIYESSSDIKKEPEVVNLAEAFQLERCLVILGDPGSGKTTLLTWLALHLAKAMMRQDLHKKVYITLNQIDHSRTEESPADGNLADDKEADEKSIASPKKPDHVLIEMGPVRLPVLLRIAEYAQELAKYKKNNQDLQIIDFLGYHTWMGHEPLEKIAEDRSLSKVKEVFNSIIKNYISKGEAVIFLDGLDEIPNFEDRHEIVARVVRFISEHLYPRNQFDYGSHQQKTKISSFKNYYKGTPKEVGGNQIIITSRVAGYHEAPISNIEMAHLTIEPMQLEAIMHFCRLWYKAIMPDKEEAKKKADDLNNSLTQFQNTGTLELASNPLLVTIIALVHRSGRLPENRSELYNKAFEIFRQDFLQRKQIIISPEKLTILLAGIATEIHTQYPSGLIGEKELTSLINKISKEQGIKIDEDFIQTFKTSIGIIVARGPSLYGFIHLTFQEYLAGISLVFNTSENPINPAEAAKRIVFHIDDPRWREPILLALGFVRLSPDWREDQEELYKFLLDYSDPIGELIPRIPLLILQAVREKLILSDELVYKLIDKLLYSYSLAYKNKLESAIESLVLNGFSDILRGKGQAFVVYYLTVLLKKSEDTVLFVLITLIQKKEWFFQEVIDKMIMILNKDRKEWNWIINRTIQLALNMDLREKTSLKEPEELSKEDWKKLKEKNFGEYIELRKRYKIAQEAYRKNRLLSEEKKASNTGAWFPLEKLEFRKELEGNEKLLERIEKKTFLKQAIIAIYGGFRFCDAVNTNNEYLDIAVFLQKTDTVREAYIKNNREYYVSKWGADDVIYNMAVYLDTNMGGKLLLSKMFPRIDPQAIYNDSALTQLIIDAVWNDAPDKNFIDYLIQLYKSSEDELEQLDALTVCALALEPEEQLPALLKLHPALVKPFHNKIEFTIERLKDPLLRIFINKEIGINNLLNKLYEHVTELDFSILIHALAKVYTFYFNMPFQVDKLVSSKQLDLPVYILSEDLVTKLFNDGRHSDDIDKQTTDALNQLKSLTLHEFCETISLIPFSANFQVYSQRIRWNPDINISLNQNRAVTIIPIRLIDNIVSYRAENIKYDLRNSLIHIFLEKSIEFIETKRDILLELLIIDYKNHNFSTGLTLSKYASELGLSIHFLDHERIIAEIRKINSPYYKVRALLRLSKYLPARRKHLLDEAYASVQLIKDSFEKFEVLSYLSKERVVKDLNLDILINKIEDPVKYMYSAIEYASINDMDVAVQYLNKGIYGIKSDAVIFNVIRCLDCLMIDDNIREHLKQRLKTSGKQGLLPLLMHEKYEKTISATLSVKEDILSDSQKEILPLLSVSCKMYELHQEFIRKSKSLKSLWKELPANPDATVNLLYEMGVRDGLVLTKAAADSLSEMIKQQKSASVLKLFPLLESPSSDAIPIVTDWLSDGLLKNRILKNDVILIIRESGRNFQAEEIKYLIKCLNSDNDRILLRSQLLIHSNMIGNRKFEERKIKISSVDKEVVYEMARQSIAWERLKPVISGRIRLYYSAVIFDDVPFMQEICSNILEGKRQAESIMILDSIQYMEKEVGDVLIENFSGTNAELQKAIIKCFANCSTEYHIAPYIDDQWSIIYHNITTGLAKLTDETGSEIVLTENLLYTLAVITDTANKAGNNLSLEEIRSIGEGEFMKIMPSISTLLETGEQFKTLPRTIAQLNFVYSNYLEKYDQVSEMVLDQPHLFTYILEKLEQQLLKDQSSDRTSFNGILHHLLLASSTAVVQNQSSFNNYHGIERLVALLKTVAKFHTRFVCRLGAIKLLGYYRRSDREIIDILIKSFDDDVDVRNAAEDAMERIKNVDDWIIDDLIQKMQESSGTVSLNIAQVLTSLGRSSKTRPEKRNEIMHILAQCVLDKNYDKPIYKFSGTGWKTKDDELKIVYEGDLKEKIYSLLLKLNGFNPVIQQ